MRTRPRVFITLLGSLVISVGLALGISSQLDPYDEGGTLDSADLTQLDSDQDGWSDSVELAWCRSPVDATESLTEIVEDKLVVFLEGKQSRATVLDGEEFNPRNSLSIAARVKAGPDAEGTIASKGSCALAVHEGNLVFSLSLGGDWYSLTAPISLDADRSVFVAATYDGLCMKLYADRAQPLAVAHTGGAIDSDGEPFQIGENQGGLALADLLVFDRSVQDGEVALLASVLGGGATDEARTFRQTLAKSRTGVPPVSSREVGQAGRLSYVGRIAR